jgi:hypothetical protein
MAKQSKSARTDRVFDFALLAGTARAEAASGGVMFTPALDGL